MKDKSHDPIRPKLTPITWLGLFYGALGYGLALIGTLVLFLALVLLMGAVHNSNYMLYLIIGAVKDVTWDAQRFIALAPAFLLSWKLWKNNAPLSFGTSAGGLLGMLILWVLFPPHLLASD